MKKVIEVKTWETVPSSATEVGFFDCYNCLYFVAASQTIPYYLGSTKDLLEEVDRVAAASGVSELTLLKAIAIAQKPELAKELT